MNKIGKSIEILIWISVAILVASSIYSNIKSLPKFEDLVFLTGTIEFVHHEVDRKGNRHIPIILNCEGNKVRIKLRTNLNYTYLKSKQGRYATIGTWPTHNSFFIKRLETWHVVIDDKIEYDYKDRYARVEEYRPYFLATNLLIPAIILFWFFYRRTKTKNQQTGR